MSIVTGITLIGIGSNAAPNLGINTEQRLESVALSTTMIYGIDDYGVHTDEYHAMMTMYQSNLVAMKGPLAVGVGSTDARYLSIPAAIGVASSFLAVGIAVTITGISTYPRSFL